MWRPANRAAGDESVEPDAAEVALGAVAPRLPRGFLQLGVVRGWSLSVAEAGIGLAIVGLALRESVPGRAVSTRALVLTFAGRFVLPLLVLWLT
jgi:hypothetical protein